MGIKDAIKEKISSSKVSTEDVEINSVSEIDLEAKRVAELEEYNERYPEPTEEDYANLKKTIGHAPYVTYLVCLVEFAERASYYGVRDRLANFVQLPLPEGGNGAGAPPSGSQKNAGALGLGLRVSSAVTLMLTFLAYLTPLWGGYISDKKWGRMKTIWYGVWVGALSHIILIIAALPSVIASGKAALAPTIISILCLAVGTGLIKPNLLPLLYDQYEHKRDIIKTNKSGERTIVSRETTLERMTLVFYWSVNVGSFLSLGTSYCAKRVGFWLAFLIPGIVYFVMVPVLILLKPKLKKEKPNGVSVIEEALKVTAYNFKSGWFGRLRKGQFWDHAKPSNIVARGELESTQTRTSTGKKAISWTDQFVQDVKVTLDACKIFLFFVIYNINDSGIGNIETSQANSMTTNGVPNDLINNFNPLTIIILIPILDYVVYPMLRRYNIDFRPVYRIFFGFILAALSQVAGAIIQWRVYKTSPCGYHATECDIGTGVSHISVWVEAVLYVLAAASECFAMTAAYEIAYARAPDQMKGLVMALFLFMQSLSAAVSQAASASLIDPYLIWPFGACAVVGFLMAFWFLYLYRDLHKVMEKERIEKEELLKQEFFSHLRNKEEFADKISGVASINEKMEAEEDINKIQAIESALSTKRM